ncbi:hypothetical protein BDD43_5527 [Mucilaginibacter gracilis]|uniref:Outer membrane protein with beta-barrel domain n=1 Tax=Mucilaginibacter gracilis TaxID=423350 RepID=A0A495J907_9SPHI|nr:DUF3575 domain-containing protein [Mucilaginibacter gracilis]RKR85263.1 hypothetical protein BDD43_5527 [Mucilaginibacter gracilis]
MKKFLFVCIALFVFKSANAQYRGQTDNKNIFLSLGAEIGIPSNTPYNLTYGAAAQAEIKLMPQLGLTFSGQYTAYNYKSSLLANSDAEKHPSFIPLKAGLKYYTSPNFYFGGELGSTVQSNNGTGNMFVYALGFGFDVPLDKHSDIEIGFAYQNYSASQYQTTGMRVAYRVGW